ncbi:helix-turn-helix transcriptional regulator [Nocardia inohanensis]|uniref:helix-turn-helix transcriptional regulator n=1 Tax=Nocardia inohanensis TaxID=209246 RepID=UPI00082EE404|nr:hypothetical protein [Nocardia inohanensis]
MTRDARPARGGIVRFSQDGHWDDDVQRLLLRAEHEAVVAVSNPTRSPNHYRLGQVVVGDLLAAGKQVRLRALDQFARMAWESAAGLAVALDPVRPEIDAALRAVLGTLALGLKDETAARRLGVSLRTYRRQVADLMARLGVSTRFQIGVRAAELGLLRSPG